MNSQTTFLDKVNNWLKNSLSLKLVAITFLMLLMLIPASMIQSIISERQSLRRQTISEVSQKWANRQSINGPILTIPITYEERYTDDDDNEKVKEYIKYFQILPDDLSINGQIDPTRLRRSIYEVVVYESDLDISGAFTINKPMDKNNLKKIHYDQAFMTIGISDLRGIKNQITVKWSNQELEVEPGSKVPELIRSGITVLLPDLSDMIENQFNFQMKVDLQGSQNISFTPLGKTTDITMTSEWPSPSFNGAFLPDERDVSESGFSAQWQVLQLNRNYPQFWLGNDYNVNIRESSFGIDLLLPVNDYQKSMRSAKYGVMTIALTFLMFFIIEILHKRKIHPFQYTLVGFALLLFYILLISISEHLNFNKAYIISSIAVIGMITLYSMTVFKKNKLSVMLMAILSAVYGFIFTTMQLTEYALLMGSVGLAVILALTMYFTRNVNWYKLNETENK